MIPKSVKRFSEKIMLKAKNLKSDPAKLGQTLGLPAAAVDHLTGDEARVV
jgi:hypothetical protein